MHPVPRSTREGQIRAWSVVLLRRSAHPMHPRILVSGVAAREASDDALGDQSAGETVTGVTKWWRSAIGTVGPTSRTVALSGRSAEVPTDTVTRPGSMTRRWSIPV